MLRLGGYINILIALAHILCLFWAETFFDLTGVGDQMRNHAATHPLLPYAITVFVAVIFFIFGLYGLSGAGRIKSLPLLKIGVFGIAAVYLLRGVGGIIVNVVLEPVFLWYHLLFSAIAFTVGLLYLFGGLKRWKR